MADVHVRSDSRRRSTRVVLKIVILVEGVTEPLMCDGVTLVVNRHGALISAGVPLRHELRIKIQVVLTGMRAHAKVVHIDPDRPQLCGIALEEPENIWDLPSPPDDCSTLISWKQVRSYREEPGQRAQQIDFHDNTAFSSFPVITASGLFFQSMDPDRYVIRWSHQSQLEEISLHGNGFHPIPLPDGSSIALEVSFRGGSTMLRFDSRTKQLTPLPLPISSDDESPATLSVSISNFAYSKLGA